MQNSGHGLYPNKRMRRLRSNEIIRKMVKRVYLSKEDFIYPIFLVEGENIKNPIHSMPGIYQYSIDLALDEIRRCESVGIKAIMLFGVPNKKDSIGTEAYADNGIIQRALKIIKNKFPAILVSTDVCLCEYTDHGHCGLVKEGYVENDPTLELLAKVAISHAKAGADILSPSDMMDGRVRYLRKKLDDAGFCNVPLMTHCAKFASSFYGPFRDAADSAPQFGDRKSYQMDPRAGINQAMEEIALDIHEGTDFIIVKPGLAYMDVIRTARERFDLPIVTYNVSGEYAMVKAAAQQGWIDEKKIVMEMMTSFKRAGADIIITYHAIDVAQWLEEE